MTRINHSPLPDVGFRFARTLLLLSLLFLPFLAYFDYQDGYYLPAYAKFFVLLVCVFGYIYSKSDNYQQLVRIGVATSLLLMSAVGAYYKLDSYSGLIWVPVLPLLFCFIVGINIGIIYTSIYLTVYTTSYFTFESLHHIPPIELDVWLVSVAAYAFVLTVTVLFQKEINKGENHLKAVAKFDFLTQILNRRGFVPRIEGEIARINRYGGTLSLIVADIDNFKRVNDQYGHGVGDRILIEFVDLLVQYTRSTDLVARWGGEEFVILASNTGLNDCRELAEKLRSCIELHHFTTGGPITSSFGITQYRLGESWSTFLERTDECLLNAKHAGKNRIATDDLSDIEIDTSVSTVTVSTQV